MKTSSTLTVVVAALAASLAIQGASAQTSDKKLVATDKTAVLAATGPNDSDRAHMKSWSSEQDMLRQALKVGASKSDYRKVLADNGYTITAINKDSADYLEYEVVKGAHSYEVQIDLDKKTRMGSKVEVDRNQWRADATTEAMRGGRPVMATRTLTNGDVYSDRVNNKGWNNQKETLEKGLLPGRDLAYYTGELKKMGYQITSTNDKDKDYVEIEIVKGRDSYEVQMDLDGAGKARKVDVTSNMWQTEATEKALSRTP
jgi:DNA-dependent RNA polymerase auxiliary subunit epsilon